MNIEARLMGGPKDGHVIALEEPTRAIRFVKNIASAPYFDDPKELVPFEYLVYKLVSMVDCRFENTVISYYEFDEPPHEYTDADVIDC